MNKETLCEFEKRLSALEDIISEECRACSKKLPVGVGLQEIDRFCSKPCKQWVFWSKRAMQLHKILDWNFFSHEYGRGCTEGEEMCKGCVNRLEEHLKDRYKSKDGSWWTKH